MGNPEFTSAGTKAVARELTKIYEETYRGTVEEAIVYFSAKTVKGEIVIVIEGMGTKPLAI